MKELDTLRKDYTKLKHEMHLKKRSGKTFRYHPEHALIQLQASGQSQSSGSLQKLPTSSRGVKMLTPAGLSPRMDVQSGAEDSRNESKTAQEPHTEDTFEEDSKKVEKTVRLKSRRTEGRPEGAVGGGGRKGSTGAA